MTFALSPDQVEALQARLAAFEQEVRQRYPDEKQLSITLTPVANGPNQAASAADSAKAVQLMLGIPQGVYAWSKEFAGLPETSNNIGIVKTENKTLNIIAFQRSFSPEKLQEIAQGIEAAAANAGANSARRSSFPTWPPNPDSELYKKSLAVYEQLFRTPMKTEVLHAGLECGYIAAQYPGMEIVSIGPTLEHVHTPRERLYVPSLEKVSRFMDELLRDL
jgi:dipeptidase D